MEHQVTISIEFMMKSHYELARILEAERHVMSHLSQVITAIPNKPPSFGNDESTVELCLEVTQSLSTYLSSLGDLEESLADNLELVIAELHLGDTDE